MDDASFQELLASVREAGAILRGKKKACRVNRRGPIPAAASDAYPVSSFCDLFLAAGCRICSAAERRPGKSFFTTAHTIATSSSQYLCGLACPRCCAMGYPDAVGAGRGLPPERP